MNHNFPSFLAGFLIVGLPAAGLAQDPVDPPPRPGMVWELRAGEHVHYVAGALHIDREDLRPLPPSYDAAFEACSTLILETDLSGVLAPSFQQTMMKLGTYPPGTDASRELPRKLHRDLLLAGGKLGISPDMINRFRPWMSALTLTMAGYRDAGFNIEKGIDRTYFEKAQAVGRPMEFLEKPEQQLRFFAELPDAVQIDQLRQSLDDLDQLAEASGTMIKAFLAGDADGLDALIRDSFEECDTVFDILFTQRNQDWVPQLQKHFKRPKPVMVLVGAGHLVGVGGLIDLLEKAGWSATLWVPGDASTRVPALTP